MFIDIVFPKNNEQKIVDMAVKLGLKGLLFVYTKKKDLSKLDAKGLKIYQKEIVLKENPTQHDLRKGIDIVHGFEHHPRRDHTHYRNAGVNQVIAKLCKEKNILFGFNFNKVLSAEDKQVLLGRMMQNYIIMKKYKVPVVFFSGATDEYGLRSYKDVKNFFEVIFKDKLDGDNLDKRLKENKFKKSEKYVSEGVRKV